jgi:hypothetical protein
MYSFNNATIGIFVPNAPCYISQNINTKFGLSNGTKAEMYSLTFDSASIGEEDIALLENMISNAIPGKRIHLPFAPQYINIKVNTQIWNKWPTHLTLVENKLIINNDFDDINNNHSSSVIIPIGLKDSTTEKIMITAGNQKPFILKDSRIIKHRLDLGWIITNHKVMGKTIEKIILSLNERHFLPRLTLNMLIVALSRVKEGKNIRIIPLLSENELNYLKNLTYDEDYEIWFNGFDKLDNIWKPQKSRDYLEFKIFEFDKQVHEKCIKINKCNNEQEKEKLLKDLKHFTKKRSNNKRSCINAIKNKLTIKKIKIKENFEI